MSHKSKLGAALVGVAMLFALSVAGVKIPGLGGGQTASAFCYGITIYEKVNKTGYNANTNCNDRSNLKDYKVNIPTGTPCDGQFFFSYGTWNDCISSVAWSFDGNSQACFNTEASYTGNVLKIGPGNSGWGNMPSTWDNSVSSIDYADVNCFPNGDQD